MFARSKMKRQRRKIIRQDREHLEVRVRQFLNGYLSASDNEKDCYFDVVTNVVAACQPEKVVSFTENLQVAAITQRQRAPWQSDESALKKSLTIERMNY
jgi:hypothetical protein